MSLLGGVNDQPENAREVLALLKGMRAKVNLIVWNPGPGVAYRQPTPEDVAVFHRMLVDGGIPTFTRRPRGRDIYAACGQLKRTVEGQKVEGQKVEGQFGAVGRLAQLRKRLLLLCTPDVASRCE